MFSFISVGDSLLYAFWIGLQPFDGGLIYPTVHIKIQLPTGSKGQSTNVVPPPWSFYSMWTLSQILVITQLEILNMEEVLGGGKGRESPWVTRRQIKLWVLRATETVSQWLEAGNGFPTSCEFENPICGTKLSCYFKNSFIFFRDISGALPSSWKAASSPQKSLHQQELRHFACNCIILEMWLKKYSSLGEEEKLQSNVSVSTSWAVLDALFFFSFSLSKWQNLGTCNEHNAALLISLKE